MLSAFLFLLMAFLSEIAGTLGGFGSSVFFVPLAGFFFEFKAVLMLTALLHDFSNVSKLVMFRRHIDVRILLLFGIPSTLFVIGGAMLSKSLQPGTGEWLLGIFLVMFSLFILWKPTFRISPTPLNNMAGGSVAGFLAGLIGTGGAIRGLSLAALNLEKSSFVATSAAIDFFVDLSRTVVYYKSGYSAGAPLHYLPWLLLAAMAGTWIGKKLLDRISQESFRRLVLVLLLLTGLVMIGKRVSAG